MRSPIYGFLLLILVMGCTDSNTGEKSFFGCINCTVQKVEVSKLKPALLDSDLYEPIQIIAAYPTKEITPGNSNLYKCIFGRKHDTVFVFELNEKVDYGLLKEIAKEENGVIMDNKILKSPPKSTLIYVPEKF